MTIITDEASCVHEYKAHSPATRSAMYYAKWEFSMGMATMANEIHCW